MQATDSAATDERDAAMLAQGIDPVTGFAHDGEWPVNARLRSETMAKAGVVSDPNGMVSDELIAMTKDRLDRETAEAERLKAEAEAKTPSLKWTEKQLREEAARVNVTVETDANKAAILAAIEAAPAAPQTEG